MSSALQVQDKNKEIGNLIASLDAECGNCRYEASMVIFWIFNFLSKQLYGSVAHGNCVGDMELPKPAQRKCHWFWPIVHPPNCQIAFPNCAVSLFKDKDNQLSGGVDEDNSSGDKSNIFSSSDFTWILDGGASHHMTIAIPLSQNVYNPFQCVQLPNGASLLAYNL